MLTDKNGNKKGILHETMIVKNIISNAASCHKLQMDVSIQVIEMLRWFDKWDRWAINQWMIKCFHEAKSLNFFRNYSGHVCG